MSAVGTTLDRVEQLAKILGVCIAAFGVWKYFDVAHQNTVDRSLSHYDAFHAGRVFEARHWIAEMGYRLIALRKEAPADSASEAAVPLEDLLIGELSTAPGVLHYDVAIEYFERVKSCIDTGSCDRKTALALLAEEAERLRFYFRPMMDRRATLGDTNHIALLCIASRYEAEGCETG